MTLPARLLTPTEHEAFRLARLVAAEHAPYFMHALFAAAPVGAPGLGTFAVDGAWRLYMDPELLVGPARWPSPTAAAVLLHEVGHLIRDHAGRAEALPHPSTTWRGTSAETQKSTTTFSPPVSRYRMGS